MILKEVYAVDKGNKIETVGIWREGEGLKVPIESMWERRNNMEGMQLRVGTKHFPLRVVRFQNFLELESGFRDEQMSWNRNQLHTGTGSALGIGSRK